jgi:hypothetical protein
MTPANVDRIEVGRNGQTVVEIRRMGPLEIRRRRSVRMVDGWAIFVDGREHQPWFPKVQALREAASFLSSGIGAEMMRESGVSSVRSPGSE